MFTAWIVLLACACGIGQEPCFANTSTDLLQRAIQQYDRAMDTSERDERLRGFKLSEQLFRQVIEGTGGERNQVENAAIYVNLGNAALQAERIGPAIVAYRRALQFDPRNAQAIQNLAFARDAIPERYQQQATSGLIETLFFWNELLPRAQVLGLAGCCFFLACVVLSAGILWRQSLLRNLAVLPLLCWIVLLSSVAFHSRGTQLHGVVVANELVVHSADSENSAPRLSEPIFNGVEVRILRQRERWTEIELSGGHSGWVLSSGLERV